jgi:hypothetical protein
MWPNDFAITSRWQAERGGGVPDRAARPVGLHHRDAAAAFLAVGLDDRAVGLDPPGRLDIQVDVGQPGTIAEPALGEEPFHDQAMLERVDVGDADQVVDQAARSGAADRAADAAGPDQGSHVGHGEEVPGEPGAGDDVELTGQTLGGFVVTPRPGTGAGQATAVHSLLAPPAKLGEFAAAGDLGQVQKAKAQVVPGVEGAAVGQLRGGGEQMVGGVVTMAGTAVRDGGGAGIGAGAPGLAGGPRRAGVRARAADPCRDAGHLLAVLEIGLRVVPGQVAAAERGELAGRVEHLRHRVIGGIEVAGRVGQHGGQAGLAGQPQHPGGVPGAAGAEVVHDLDHHLGPVPPAGQGGLRGPGVPGGDRAPDVAGRAEQHDQPVGVLGDQIWGDRGDAPLPRPVRGADQVAKRRPAAGAGGAGTAGGAACGAAVMGAVVGAAGQQGHPGRGFVRQPRRGHRAGGGGRIGIDRRAARDARVGRRNRAGRGRRAVRGGRAAVQPGPAARRELRVRCLPQCQVGADDRRDFRLGARLGVLDRPVQSVPVGERQRPHAGRLGPLGQSGRAGRAVPHRVRRRDVQMNEFP